MIELLPGVPTELVLTAYADAPGNEIESGKFASPESSAALAANAFGWFLERPGELPPLPGTEQAGWPATSVQLEVTVRFPWSGGRHPCLDALITTSDWLIGIESKRYESWRGHKPAAMSNAYWRPVWGERTKGYERVRDGLRDRAFGFRHLDAAQFVKHAFGLRTAVHSGHGSAAILVYVYAEPVVWLDGRWIDEAAFLEHREELRIFSEAVVADEVRFVPLAYRDLFGSWNASASGEVKTHADRLRRWSGI